MEKEKKEDIKSFFLGYCVGFIDTFVTGASISKEKIDEYRRFRRDFVDAISDD